MIHWAWLILAYVVGGMVGIGIVALLKSASDGEKHG